MKFILRTAISLAIAYGVWHWYGTNVVAQLEAEALQADFDESFDTEEYSLDRYEREEREEDKGFAYDDFDTGDNY